MRKKRRVGGFYATVMVLILSAVAVLSVGISAFAADIGMSGNGDTDVINSASGEMVEDNSGANIITIEDQQVPLAGNVVIEESSSTEWLWIVLIAFVVITVTVLHRRGVKELVDDVSNPQNYEKEK